MVSLLNLLSKYPTTASLTGMTGVGLAYPQIAENVNKSLTDALFGMGKTYTDFITSPFRNAPAATGTVGGVDVPFDTNISNYGIPFTGVGGDAFRERESLENLDRREIEIARDYFRNRVPGEQGFGVDLTMSDNEVRDFYNTTIDMEQKAVEDAAAAAKAAEAGQFGLQDAYMAAQLLRMTGLLGNNQPPIRMVNQLPQRGLLLDEEDMYGMRRI